MEVIQLVTQTEDGTLDSLFTWTEDGKSYRQLPGQKMEVIQLVTWTEDGTLESYLPGQTMGSHIVSNLDRR